MAVAGDVVYYGGGLSMALLMGMQPMTRAARLPLVGVLLANWGAEHWLMQLLRPHLEADAAGVVYAVLPKPRLLSSAITLLHYYGGRASPGSELQVSVWWLVSAQHFLASPKCSLMLPCVSITRRITRLAITHYNHP